MSKSNRKQSGEEYLKEPLEMSVSEYLDAAERLSVVDLRAALTGDLRRSEMVARQCSCETRAYLLSRCSCLRKLIRVLPSVCEVSIEQPGNTKPSGDR
jgi:hypothetical protein